MLSFVFHWSWVMGADKRKSSPDLNSVDWTLTTSAGDSEGGIIPSQVSYHDLQVLRQSPHLHTKLSQQSTPTSSYTVLLPHILLYCLWCFVITYISVIPRTSHLMSMNRPLLWSVPGISGILRTPDTTISFILEWSKVQGSPSCFMTGKVMKHHDTEK